MTARELVRRALHYLSVPRCVCCRHALALGEGALCADCRVDVDNAKERTCSVCFSPLYRCTCAPEYLKAHFVRRLIKITRYVPEVDSVPSNRLIYALKEEHRQDVLDDMATELASAIRAAGCELKNALFVEVPRRRRAIIEYGYDHAHLLARTLARHLGAECRTLLYSTTPRAQKGLRRFERAHNVHMHIRRRARHTDLSGRPVFLVDDIVTTGHSMGYAAALLRALGARSITGVCFSIAYPDPSIEYADRPFSSI